MQRYSPHPPPRRPISQLEIFIPLCKSLLQFLATGGNLIQILRWPGLLVLCNHSPVEFIIVQPSNLKERNDTGRPGEKHIYCVSLENEKIFISE